VSGRRPWSGPPRGQTGSEKTWRTVCL